jgi:hypothetical protein
MFVYSETVYRSVATGTFEVTRRCSSCNKSSEARVTSLSEGQAESAFGLTNKQDVADDRAMRGLAAIAKSTADLGACPHCSAREPSVLAFAKRGALVTAAKHVGGIALLVLAAGTLWVGFMTVTHPRVDTSHKIITFLVGAAFVAGWFLVARSSFRKHLRAQLETADGKIVWLVPGATPVAEAPPPVAPPPPSGGWPFA